MYPEIEPFSMGHLKVSQIHSIYWEESGNPKGKPVLFLHGGPGSCTQPMFRRFFDPSVYRIILTDQRGCGKSTPHASLEQNTTWDLVEDLEKLRSFLQIDQWVVFGGSWGSTLALAYAICHFQKAKGLVLRGIFLLRKKELHWFYQFGAHHLFPDEWEKFLSPIPTFERSNLIAAYHKRLISPDPKIRANAARHWSGWEAATLKLLYDPVIFANFTATQHADSLARIECHYFINKGFFESDNWILENIHKIRHLPCYIIHGRYDVVCPLESAWELHKIWPEATLQIIPDAGHALSEPGIQKALIESTDAFRTL